MNYPVPWSKFNNSMLLFFKISSIFIKYSLNPVEGFVSKFSLNIYVAFISILDPDE